MAERPSETGHPVITFGKLVDMTKQISNKPCGWKQVYEVTVSRTVRVYSSSRGEVEAKVTHITPDGLQCRIEYVVGGGIWNRFIDTNETMPPLIVDVPKGATTPAKPRVVGTADDAQTTTRAGLRALFKFWPTRKTKQ